jgi:hypothetical protein
VEQTPMDLVRKHTICRRFALPQIHHGFLSSAGQDCAILTAMITIAFHGSWEQTGRP